MYLALSPVYMPVRHSASSPKVGHLLCSLGTLSTVVKLHAELVLLIRNSPKLPLVFPPRIGMSSLWDDLSRATGLHLVDPIFSVSGNNAKISVFEIDGFDFFRWKSNNMRWRTL